MKRSLVFYFVLSLTASAINYLAYPVLARILPQNEYVDITVALSLLTQIATFMSALTAITIGLSKQKDGTSVISKLQNSLLQIFIVLSITFLIFSPFIFHLIQTPVFYAFPIVIMIILSIPITIISGYLNGKALMVKLGLVAFVTASIQLATGVIAAIISRNGIVTMSVMGLAQIISILLLVRVLNEPSMPIIDRSIFKLEPYSAQTKKILVFAIVSAFAIMAINLLQVVDLILIRSLGNDTAKLYADMYIISRVVFFLGTILIWPFLGELSLSNHRHNRFVFIKLIGQLGLLGLAAILVSYLFGDKLSYILFGTTYQLAAIQTTLILSILYKLLFIVITASCLYLTVVGSYLNALVGLTSIIIIAIAAILPLGTQSVNTFLLGLTIGAAAEAMLASCIVWFHPPKTIRTLAGQ